MVNNQQKSFIIISERKNYELFFYCIYRIGIQSRNCSGFLESHYIILLYKTIIF